MGIEALEKEYAAKFPTSRQLYERAAKVFPSGVTHDVRYFRPFPIYIQRALAAKKWDVDGNELTDYVMGHGALMLGHSHPALVKAIQEQVAKGTHYGACQELEVRWGELVKELVPSAERVKFTSSGTEATMLAIRLARAYTGRSKVLVFANHFHGWHDYVFLGPSAPYDVPLSIGIPQETLRTVVVAPPNDIGAVRKLLEGNGDVACVILEPAGGRNGTVPTKPGFLADLRELTREKGVVLIFDEVITGFRYAPGGAQEFYGVTPDMTTMAKALTGALPGGAVAGRKELLAPMEFGDARHNRFNRVAHQGTFNANPLAAACGIASLEILASGEVQEHANCLGRDLRQGMNEVLEEQEVPGLVYGESSQFHILLGIECPRGKDTEACALTLPLETLGRGSGTLVQPLKLAMYLEGIDLMREGGMLSGVHSQDDVERTILTFNNALVRMRQEGILQ